MRSRPLKRKPVKKTKPTKKQTKADIKSLKAKAWKLMSEWVRRSHADWRGIVQCISCPAKANWREFHAGHYKHNVLNTDPKNIHPQCPRCNLYYSGRLDMYSLYLVRTYGVEILDELDKKATAERKRIDKLGYAHTPDELKKIIDDLKEKIKAIDTSR